ncbi:uncharacterized protein RCH25_018277 [Pelodytes ibericus]
MTSHRTRVAVIGAGAAGLCCARHLLSRPLIYEPPVVFETSGQVGGTWVYAEGSEGESHSSMYRDLRTNLPKEIMEFPDFGFDPSLPSFIHHTEVLRYLEDYTDKFGVRPHIRFNCRVTSVFPILRGADSGSIPWNVTSQARGHPHPVTERFDAIMVCVGHYSRPYTPEIAGLHTFKGNILHSHFYRYPEIFSSRSVVLLGSGPSGVDIAMELAPYAKHVTLSYRGSPLKWTPPENLTLAPPVVKASPHALICEDGTLLEADTLIFCTGYKYHYPFLVPEEEHGTLEGLDKNLGSEEKGPFASNGVVEIPEALENSEEGLSASVVLQKPKEGMSERLYSSGLLENEELLLPDEGQGHLPPLYKHFIHARYPTMSFISPCKIVIPFPHFHCQALFFLAVLEGRYLLPPPKQMLSESRQELRNHLSSGLALKYLHRLEIGQWEYNHWLAESAGFKPLPPVLQKMYEYCRRFRSSDPKLYRDLRFDILNTEECRVTSEQGVENV